MESLKVSIILPVKAAELYKSWLDSKKHAAFTGGKARQSSKVNARHSAWDGYISGKNLELKPGKKIVQTWRTLEFAEGAPDSILEVSFEEKAGKTKMKIYHHGLQKGDAKKYRDGWKQHYFEPMKAYFGK